MRSNGAHIGAKLAQNGSAPMRQFLPYGVQLNALLKSRLRRRELRSLVPVELPRASDWRGLSKNVYTHITAEGMA